MFFHVLWLAKKKKAESFEIDSQNTEFQPVDHWSWIPLVQFEVCHHHELMETLVVDCYMESFSARTEFGYVFSLQREYKWQWLRGFLFTVMLKHTSITQLEEMVTMSFYHPTCLIPSHSQTKPVRSTLFHIIDFNKLSFLMSSPIKISFITPVTGSVSNRLADLFESDHFIWKKKKGMQKIVKVIQYLFFFFFFEKTMGFKIGWI